jgi:hypothetical protein
MLATATRAATGTTPYTSVLHITRKVQADLLAIGDTYEYFTEDYTQDVINDLRVFIDEEVVDQIRFIWTQAGRTKVLDALRYVVIDGVAGLADDRPGGIRYDSALASADFHVRITYNSRWKKMDIAERRSVRSQLALSWGAAGQLDYTGGRWIDDRTYSMDSKGLVRNRFVR